MAPTNNPPPTINISRSVEDVSTASAALAAARQAAQSDSLAPVSTRNEPKRPNSLQPIPSTASLDPSSAARPELVRNKSSFSKFVSLPFDLQWRTATLRAQRLVPSKVTYITSPLGPHPDVIDVPSRGKGRTIPCWVFVPPREKVERVEKEKKEKEIIKPGESGEARDKRAEKEAKKAEKEAKKVEKESRVQEKKDHAAAQKLSRNQTRKLPVHLDFHGGGFTTGSCTEQAPFCALIARETGRVVISVDYRLGPIDKYPAANEDAEDILSAILDPNPKTPGSKTIRTHLSKEKVEIDTQRISIGGFSSGGNLALGLSVPESPLTMYVPKEQTVPLLLFYPSLDARLLPHERPKPPGMPEDPPATGVLSLTTTLMSGMSETYIPLSERHELKASPGLAKPDEYFPGIKVLLVNAEWDTLALQGREWTERMRAAGWDEDKLEVVESKGMKHGWTQFPERWLEENAVKERDVAFQRCVEILKGF